MILSAFRVFRLFPAMSLSEDSSQPGEQLPPLQCREMSDTKRTLTNLLPVMDIYVAIVGLSLRLSRARLDERVFY